ncbi:glycoside hydrolase family 20 zincin-like fold domain-containing protein [Tundrisphaera lichenicola]|uniref:glycoside hydrolase family 20 zincin-like fold domain-containing protein n=1 Tax=Tundrisphaera lichenicola TaxID=2029860 RepID=UPI003EBA123E
MIAALTALCLTGMIAAPAAGAIDLSHATVVNREEGAGEAERTAGIVLIEEAERRTGIRWARQSAWPKTGAVIVATSKLDDPGEAPAEVRAKAASLKPEGFVLSVDTSRPGQPTVWIVGADARGVLFGVGKLLRLMEMTGGSATIGSGTSLATSPRYPIRGHQLGYRNRANSWDAWDAKQFEQYIRELALFGSNCVENIPFEDGTSSPLMKISRAEMNVRMSEICRRYDQDYWLWTPADFDLKDVDLRAKALKEHEDLYKACPRLDAIFVPGGDPGDNDPSLVMPFLKDLADRLAKDHPRAKVWLSLQGFEDEQAEFVYRYLDEAKPTWFGGIVCGPSSPSIPETRKRLDPSYPIRHYPDITHNVRAQYPIPWWDPALAMTLGREAINPRPVQYAEIHNALAPLTAGFLSYSDGVHDDVNKVVWSGLAWDPRTPVREILVEYARVFFAPEVAERAADGILALEKNWEGSLRDNGGVEATLALWDELEARSPRLEENWRWQMCLVRAVYDAYTRRRLIDETALEQEALAGLVEAPAKGSEAAMDSAMSVLRRAEAQPVNPELRRRIDELCEALFRSISLQTSQGRYHASGAERGCFLDFVDHPLNSRWWLEDQFATVRKLESEPERLARLDLLRTWENPGPGSFYDDVGNPGKSPHVLVGDITTLGLSTAHTPIPEVLWWENGKSRERPAWMVVMNWPVAMLYNGLDPEANYMIRSTGNGTCLLSIDGEPVEPSVDHRRIGEFKEFPVPKQLLKDGTLRLTFKRPVENVNWRFQSRLSELWLLKR